MKTVLYVAVMPNLPIKENTVARTSVVKLSVMFVRKKNLMSFQAHLTSKLFPQWFG